MSRILVDERHDQLLRQWRQYRGEMQRADVPLKLETVGPIDVEDQGDNEAAVTAQVRAIRWNGQTSLSGTPTPGGSRLGETPAAGGCGRAELPAWCGKHLRADACG